MGNTDSKPPPPLIQPVQPIQHTTCAQPLGLLDDSVKPTSSISDELYINSIGKDESKIVFSVINKVHSSEAATAKTTLQLQKKFEENLSNFNKISTIYKGIQRNRDSAETLRSIRGRTHVPLSDLVEHNKSEQNHKFYCADVSSRSGIFGQANKVDSDDELHRRIEIIKPKTLLDDTPKLDWTDVEEWSDNDYQASNWSNNLKEDAFTAACINQVRHRRTQVRRSTPTSAISDELYINSIGKDESKNVFSVINKVHSSEAATAKTTSQLQKKIEENFSNFNKIYKISPLSDLVEHNKSEQNHKFYCADVSSRSGIFGQANKVDSDDELHRRIEIIKPKTLLDDTPKLDWADVEEWSDNDDQASNWSNNLKEDTITADCVNPGSPRPIRVRRSTPHNHLIGSLIRDLINFNNFQVDIGTLRKRQGKDQDELIPLLKANARIFSLIVHSPRRSIVSLRPKIRYCSDHLFGNCQMDAGLSCLDVHICPYYIFDSCNLKFCKYGHTIQTVGNSTVFNTFYLGYLSESVLKEILRKVWEGAIYPKLCFTYHNGKCVSKNCMDLHLCYKHVMSLGLCPGVHTYCPFNHDIYDPCCEKVFNHFNISTNETPRDLMKHLMYALKNAESARRSRSDK